MKRIDLLIKKIKDYNPELDTAKLLRAYEFAEEKYKGLKRLSEESYLDHVLDVADKLADFKVDERTIIAGLLHDILDKAGADPKKVEEEFGEEILTLVQGFLKITELRNKSKEEQQAENIRKMILASIKDLRIIFIKLVNKYFNLKFLEYLKDESERKRIAKEALEIYAPLAYRLGMYSLKAEMEDLAFKHLMPEEYENIDEKIKEARKDREKEIQKIISMLKDEFKTKGLDFEITGRSKHYYSIYTKMHKKNLTFTGIFDFVALRIFTNTVKECYEVLGLLHEIWTPIPKEFDDYIANPKLNLYQSLHTAVIGPEGKPIEFQIRTKGMHEIAEGGVAAHWKYKGVEGDKTFDQKLNWLKQMIEFANENKSAKEFMDDFKSGLFEDEIFVFTPKGRVVQLPKGSTTVDFAYAVHTDIGSHAIGAKINGKFLPLKSELASGDVVEILTAKIHTPSREWLKFATTSKAKAKIRQAIEFLQKIPAKSFIKKNEEEQKELEESLIEAPGMPGMKIKLSKCCQPSPGCELEGYLLKKNQISVHLKGCKTTIKLKKFKAKKANVNWNVNVSGIINVHVLALDRAGLFADIFNTVKATGTTINSAKAKNAMNDLAKCTFSLDIRNLGHLEDLVKRIKKLKGIKRVYISLI
ncbi:bifunctional (p)ppGpp synthetase/guanosine-3',5'-bis(diphosphate) 3'-pyrophosphohydrolase [Candidatus Woesearchaeota archaeon]|nr:bifunctional (p)ppGpp synthetase/guanosine-3',5'-bis(diphosphate) 3'-pyrophosphohydrolase [Candidatus Woesearchaeota archaeon]